MVNWNQLLETQDVTIRVPSLPVTLALLVPAGGYLLHRWTTLPSIRSRKDTIYHGLKDVPAGPLKTRINEIYPEDILGPAQYFDTPFGKTKYSIRGPETGRKVALIHGFSIPSWIFKDVVERLVDAGFQVLTFDLYGRGYSETPEELGPVSLYTTQLALLLQHVSWSKARIVGFSMGGAVAGSFVAQFPELVDGDVVLLASVGNFPNNFPGRFGTLLTLPLFPYLGATSIGKWFKTLPPPPTTNMQQLAQLPILQWKALPRFPKTLTSSVRYGPLRGVGPSFKALGESNLRVLLVHGTADNQVAYKPFLSPILTGYLPKAKLVTLENAGHEIVLTHAEETSKAIIDFFNDGEVGP